MKVETDSVAGSPEGSVMSVSSISNPGTPASGLYRMASVSTSGYEMMSDSFDSDMENNNVFGLSVSGLSVAVKRECNTSCIIKSEPADIQTTPKKKRYTKSRVRNRSPALVEKLKKTRRSKANDRERARMHGLNDALDGLRKILPNHGEENKLTKIETLRFAYNYIFALRETLNMLDRGESIDIQDTLYSAQMSAAMKMPTASETLSQLNQHQQQLQTQEQQQPRQMSPLNIQSQLSPVGHQQQLMHPLSSQVAAAASATELEPLTSPEVSSADQHVFNDRIQCFSSVSQCTPNINQVPLYSQPHGVMATPQMQDYSQYSMASQWNPVSCASSMISYDCQAPSSSMGIVNSNSSGYAYVMVNNF